MSGIVFQFANSPLTAKITRKTVSASGTVSALHTGSTALAWRLVVDPSISGAVRISTQQLTTQFVAYGSGADTGWIAGNTQDYWFYGTAANDGFAIWEQY